MSRRVSTASSKATESVFGCMQSPYFSIVVTRRRAARVEPPPLAHAVRESDAILEWVGRWSRATQSCETRQVRKEATVAGQCVCSGQLAPGFFSNQPLALALRDSPFAEPNSYVAEFMS